MAQELAELRWMERSPTSWSPRSGCGATWVTLLDVRLPERQERRPLSPTYALVCRCDAKARAGCGGVWGLPLLQARHVEGPHRAHLHDRAEEGEKPTVTSPICPPTHRAAPRADREDGRSHLNSWILLNSRLNVFFWKEKQYNYKFNFFVPFNWTIAYMNTFRKMRNIKNVKHLYICRMIANERMQCILTSVKHSSAFWFAVGHVPGGHLPHDSRHRTCSVRQRVVEWHQQRWQLSFLFSTNIDHHKGQGVLNWHHSLLANMATFIISNMVQIVISHVVVIKLSSDLHLDFHSKVCRQ